MKLITCSQIVTNNSTVERPMTVPRGQGVKTVCVGHMIYCIGGCPGFGTLRSMERYLIYSFKTDRVDHVVNSIVLQPGYTDR